MKSIERILHLKTTHHVVINTLGNYLNVGFTVIYTLVLVRTFERAEYGIFSVLVALAAVLANVLDFGVTASIFSELPVLSKDRSKALRFLKTNLSFQTVLSLVVLVLMYFFIDTIDIKLLKLSVPRSTYLLTFLAVPLLMWQNSILNALYATKQFFLANIYINAANTVKIVALFWFMFDKTVSIETTLFSLFIVGPVSFIVLVLLNNKRFVAILIKSPLKRDDIKLSFSFTYFVSSQFFNLSTRLDLFTLSFFLPKSDVGLYAPAQKIVLTVITAVNSITQVLSPQFASITKKQEVLPLIKRGIFYMAIPVGVFIGVIITPFSMYQLFFTDRFAQTADIARILSVSYILFSLSAVPVLYFLYTLKKARYLFIVNLLMLIIVTIGCFTFIPYFGVFGPPLAYFFAYFAALIFIFVAFVKEYRSMS